MDEAQPAPRPHPRSRPLLESLLLRAVQFLRARRLDPDRPPGPWLGMVRPLLAGAQITNLLGLLAIIVLIPCVGERWWPLSVLVFLPPLVWLLPTFALLLPTWWWAPRWRIACVLAVVLGCWGLLRPSWSWPGSPAADDLVVVTNNFGQNNRQSLRPFLEAQQPDLLLLQEALGRGPSFAQAYPGYHWRAHGEFVLLSRWPIAESSFVPGLQAQAARFVVNHPHGPIAVYNVHLASPRRELNSVSHPRTFWEMLSGQSGAGTRLAAYQQKLANRRDTALALHRILEAEPLPLIAAGDFNLPAGTWLQRQVSRGLQDAHRVAGRGLGNTFPGETSQWLAFRQPWMRIDYVFTGPSWQVVDAVTEPGRRSQHRAVAARLRLPQ